MRRYYPAPRVRQGQKICFASMHSYRTQWGKFRTYPHFLEQDLKLWLRHHRAFTLWVAGILYIVLYLIKEFLEALNGVTSYSLPLEGGGLGRGCLMEDDFNTLPLIPSPPGRGDLKYFSPKTFGTAG